MTRALPLVLFLSSCTSVAPFVVTGESLAALGNQVADTNAAFNKALDAGKVTPEQYRAWAEFAKRFKLFYPTAAASWQLAVDTNDKVLAGHYAAAIAQLGSELGPFIETIQRLK